MLEQSVSAFARSLADKTPVPGGGGAAALAGALAAALGSMVCRYTLGKPKYAAVEVDIERILAAADGLRLELLSCVEADAVAFEPLSRAYALPKDAPDRQSVMDRCLTAAAEVPLRVMRLAAQGIALQYELAQKGSVLIVSDAGAGAALFRAALYAADLNVRVNTKSLSDRAAAAALDAQAEEYLRSAALADETYRLVYGRVC